MISKPRGLSLEVFLGLFGGENLGMIQKWALNIEMQVGEKLINLNLRIGTLNALLRTLVVHEFCYYSSPMLRWLTLLGANFRAPGLL